MYPASLGGEVEFPPPDYASMHAANRESLHGMEFARSRGVV